MIPVSGGHIKFESPSQSLIFDIGIKPIPHRTKYKTVQSYVYTCNKVQNELNS